jgi:Viral BACON domain
MAGKESIIFQKWPKIKQNLESRLNATQSYTSILYDLQVWTNLLFIYAYRVKNKDLLDQLAGLFMKSYNHLKTFDSYWFFAGNRSLGRNGYFKIPLPNPSTMWVKEISTNKGPVDLEVTLHSSQILYMLSHALHCFVSLPDNFLTDNMNEFIRRTPTILFDHYQRWIFLNNQSNDYSDGLGVFQTKVWDCSHGRFNHYQFLEKKLNRKFGDLISLSYCNAVRDEDLWILCGAVEMLASARKKVGLFNIDANQEAMYLEYFAIGCRLTESRLAPTQLKDFESNPIQGLSFEPGGWNSHRDLRYAGYSGAQFPEPEIENPGVPVNHTAHPLPEKLSWDISHARRFVHVFETLYRNRTITQQEFPSRQVMEQLANQVTYGVFNGDLKKPLFSNYFDGTNGWYRINYSKRKGFGYAPWDHSMEWLACGYAAWKNYQPRLAMVNQAVWDMIDSTDSQVKTFKLEHYETSIYFEGVPKWRDTFNAVKFHHTINFIAASHMPEIVEKTPKLHVNRSHINFGLRKGDDSNYSQMISIKNKGEGVLSWNVESEVPWLICSPATGVGSGEFKISLDVSHLRIGVTLGKVKISAPDTLGAPKIVDVRVRMYRSNKKMKLFGVLETPHDNDTVSGNIPVTGWVLGEVEIEKVRIYLEMPTVGRNKNLVHIGSGSFVADVRPDVAQRYGEFPNYFKAGWGYMLLTNTLANQGNGQFKLVVKARNVSGQELTLGERIISCDNANSVKPFGAIDSPSPGGVVSGTHRIIGWALTPPPAKIPEDGSTIKVFVDSLYMGNGTYNIPRKDIHELFTDYLNSEKSLAYFDLDTTKMKNGRHIMEWVVIDNDGNRAGIGSRYFFVRNK